MQEGWIDVSDRNETICSSTTFNFTVGPLETFLEFIEVILNIRAPIVVQEIKMENQESSYMDYLKKEIFALNIGIESLSYFIPELKALTVLKYIKYPINAFGIYDYVILPFSKVLSQYYSPEYNGPIFTYTTAGSEAQYDTTNFS